LIPDLRLIVKKSLIYGEPLLDAIDGDFNFLINRKYPDMRKENPDRLYAFLHRDANFYSRKHYFTDVFCNFLDTIPKDMRSKVVIFDPYGPNITSYKEKGFFVLFW